MFKFNIDIFNIINKSVIILNRTVSNIVNPKKSLGQNFLTNPQISKKIVSKLKPNEGGKQNLRIQKYD